VLIPLINQSQKDKKVYKTKLSNPVYTQCFTYYVGEDCVLVCAHYYDYFGDLHIEPYELMTVELAREHYRENKKSS
jgi:hypothetical protein